jgi:hypothetical protein
MDHIRYDSELILKLQINIQFAQKKGLNQEEVQDQQAELAEYPKYLMTAVHEQTWTINEDKAISIIALSLSTKFHPMAKTATTAYKLWRDLEDANKTTMIASKITIKHKFNTCWPEEGETILQFMDRLLLMQQQLSELGTVINELEIVYRVLGVATVNFAPIVMACCTIPEHQLSLNRIRSYFTMEQSTRQTSDQDEHQQQNQQALYSNFH